MTTETKIENRTELPAWLAGLVRQSFHRGWQEANFNARGHITILTLTVRAWGAVANDMARQIADDVTRGVKPAAWLPAYRLAVARWEHHHARLSVRCDARKVLS